MSDGHSGPLDRPADVVLSFDGPPASFARELAAARDVLDLLDSCDRRPRPVRDDVATGHATGRRSRAVDEPAPAPPQPPRDRLLDFWLDYFGL